MMFGAYVIVYGRDAEADRAFLGTADMVMMLDGSLWH